MGAGGEQSGGSGQPAGGPAPPQSFQITYNDNEGSLATIVEGYDPPSSNFTISTSGTTTQTGATTSGTTITIESNGFNIFLGGAGNGPGQILLKFVCWNTNADGSGVKYDPGDSFGPLTSGQTFYAMWRLPGDVSLIRLKSIKKTSGMNTSFTAYNSYGLNAQLAIENMNAQDQAEIRAGHEKFHLMPASASSFLNSSGYAPDPDWIQYGIAGTPTATFELDAQTSSPNPKDQTGVNSDGTTLSYYRNDNTSFSLHPYDIISSDDAVFCTHPTLGYWGGYMYGFIQGPNTSTGGGIGSGEVITNNWNNLNARLLHSSDAYFDRLPADGPKADGTDALNQGGGNTGVHGKNYVRAYRVSFWAICFGKSGLGMTESELVGMFGQSTAGTNVLTSGDADFWLFFLSSNGTYNGTHGTGTATVSNHQTYHNTNKGGVKLSISPAFNEWTYYEFTVIADLEHVGVSHRVDLNTDYFVSFGIKYYPNVFWSDITILPVDLSLIHEIDPQINNTDADYATDISMITQLQKDTINGGVIDLDD